MKYEIVKILYFLLYCLCLTLKQLIAKQIVKMMIVEKVIVNNTQSGLLKIIILQIVKTVYMLHNVKTVKTHKI